MRQIGHLPDLLQARTFGDFLYVQGVENQVEQEEGHGWAVWIHAEEDLERAARLLNEFRAEPTHPRFRAQAAGAAELREQAERERIAAAKRMKTSQHIFRKWYSIGFGPVTAVLIVMSVAVSTMLLLVRTDHRWDFVFNFFFSEYRRGMTEILHGQLWRLFTPMFIHFGFLHIFFNLLWLRELGSAIEAHEGSLRFTLFVLVLAVLSNTVQYFVTGPAFGGMSGVVYGLLSYIWMRGKLDFNSGYFVPPSTMTMMLIWFALCWTGLLGSIANTAHAVGLALGCLWGWLASRKNR